MIKLRLVGATSDLEHLVYTSHKKGRKGSHIVPVDDRLFDTLEDLVRRRRRAERDGAAAKRAAMPPVTSKLPPREVQRQLRAGRSVEQVARSAGTPAPWIEQFHGAILYERAGAIADARRARMTKSRLGESGATLGDAVTANLRSRHVAMTDDEVESAWDASRADGQPWTITLQFRFRGRAQKATWRFDPASKSLVPANRVAGDIGWIAPGRKITPPSKVAKPAAPPTMAKKAKTARKAKKRPAKRAAAKKPRRPAARKAKRATKRRTRR